MRATAFHWPFETAGKTIPAQAVEAAWREYRTVRSEAARETLLQRYIHLVRYMASRLARTFPPSVDPDDLVSAGVLGFLRALDGYDPTVGTDFSVYALTRIRGAMVDFVRTIDPLGRVTRRRLRDAARVLAGLEQELGHQPSQAQTAHKLGVTIDAYHELLTQGSVANAMSLERLESDSDENGNALTRARIPDATTKGSLTSLVDRESAARVATMVSQLSSTHQLVLHLHYVEELNFREIAMVMDISESRTTQLHSAAITALRSRTAAATVV
jgi:RNA polymerase sigma factor FliA